VCDAIKEGHGTGGEMLCGVVCWLTTSEILKVGTDSIDAVPSAWAYECDVLL
jgi:hypothetical protein